MTRRDYERAKLRGIEARQRGGKREDNPYRGKPSLRVLEGAWANGWAEENQRRRG